MGNLKHAKITDDIQMQIAQGALLPGAQIPPITELVKQYGVASATVKLALSELDGLGLIRGQRGVGSFVCDDALEAPGMRLLQQAVALSRALRTRVETLEAELAELRAG